MKNTHVLPSDKPSRLAIENNEIILVNNISNYRNSQNIYITDDSEIEKEDWVLYNNPNSNKSRILKCSEVTNTWFDYYRQTLEMRECPKKWAKKIILTTDQDLIKDGVQAQHIYITNDEEIKKGDWYLNTEEKNGSMNPFYGKLYKANQSINHVSSNYIHNLKKIILTTDQDLIKDGVQAIDDEFLEWFVKNPTCEFVRTIPDVKGLRDIFQPTEKDLYKIIIPKEEPKQDWYCPKCQSYVSSESVTFEETHQICNTSVIIQEPKQETTLEEFIKEELDGYDEIDFSMYEKFIELGAKWQLYKQDEFALSFAEWSVARALGCDTFTLKKDELEIYKNSF